MQEIVLHSLQGILYNYCTIVLLLCLHLKAQLFPGTQFHGWSANNLEQCKSYTETFSEPVPSSTHTNIFSEPVPTVSFSSENA